MTPPIGPIHPDEPLWKVRQRLADYEARLHQFDQGRLDWVPQQGQGHICNQHCYYTWPDQKPDTLLQKMLDEDEAGKRNGRE